MYSVSMRKFSKSFTLILNKYIALTFRCLKFLTLVKYTLDELYVVWLSKIYYCKLYSRNVFNIKLYIQIYEQDEQIDYAADKTAEATENILSGNDELRKVFVWIFCFLFVIDSLQFHTSFSKKINILA